MWHVCHERLSLTVHSAEVVVSAGVFVDRAAELEGLYSSLICWLFYEFIYQLSWKISKYPGWLQMPKGQVRNSLLSSSSHKAGDSSHLTRWKFWYFCLNNNFPNSWSLIRNYWSTDHLTLLIHEFSLFCEFQIKKLSCPHFELHLLIITE